MHAGSKPQLVHYLSKTLNMTPFSTRWIPRTTKFVTCGEVRFPEPHPVFYVQTTKATGVLKIQELEEEKISDVIDFNTKVRQGFIQPEL
jgi:hypothetical protein